MSEGGNFKLLKIYDLADIENGEIKELPESDLAFQTTTKVIQYEYIDEEEDKDKFTIKPGVFTLINTNAGIRPKKLDLKTHDLLETATNTALIKKEANLFFSKIDIYKKFNKDPKRSILLYSQPGMGKSSTIAKIAEDFVKEDEGTVVIFWDTSDIRPSSVSKFLSTGSKFSKKCTRMLFIMEDIGGGNVEDYGGPKSADSGLLELLDGASISFRLPTFVIATTNTPENLLKSLADRPGRFDQMFELPGPDAKERVELAKHIAKRELTRDEEFAIKGKDAEGLSIAHISEIVVRSELHDKTFSQVIKEMKDHKNKIEKAFTKAQNRLGLGM
jgi:SpoVK/Ycf46/Vps4 family AAA+-type ATPase